jgi:hypothetical protein
VREVDTLPARKIDDGLLVPKLQSFALLGFSRTVGIMSTAPKYTDVSAWFMIDCATNVGDGWL